MYEALLYSTNMNFALNVAESMYAKLKLDENEFINGQAALYCANRKNQLMCEFIESLFQIFSRERCGISDYLTSLNGTVNKIGIRYAHQVVLFTPGAGQDLESKLLKFWQIEGRDHFFQIAEGEFVWMLSYYTPEALAAATEEQIYDQNTFAGVLNAGARKAEGGNHETKRIFNTIAPGGARIEHALIGCVREVTKELQLKVFVLPNRNQQTLFESDQAAKQWKVVKVVNRSYFDKLDGALTTFGGESGMSQLLSQILLSTPGQASKVNQELAESKVTVDIKSYNINTNLNEYQQRALKAASSQLLTVIHGPPGCGKTTTAVEIVLEWLRQSTIPILAITSNHTGLDQLHGEFQKAGIKCTKIGATKEGVDLTQRLLMLRKSVTDAQVICATVNTCTNEVLNGMKFTRVLIDGASDLSELETLVPITRQCSQLVLLGDHKQTGPHALSSVARSKGISISLFERLARSGVKPIFLAVQHRMHPTLAMFPSHQFYSNNLQNGVDDSMRPIIQGIPWPNPLVRAVFCHVKGAELNYGNSVLNIAEIEVVIEILLQTLKQGSLKLNQIGIVSAYDGQNRRLRAEILAQAKVS
jgi:regulator of nonsense transcripts 1